MKHLFWLTVVSVVVWGESLSGLITYATQHSTIAKQSRASDRLASLSHRSAKAVQYGELSVVGDYTHYNIERTLAPLVPNTLGSGAPITTSKDIYSAGLRYSVPLFTGFAQMRSVEIESLASQMRQIKSRLSTEELVYTIRSLYLSILAQQEILSAQHTYRHALEKLHREIAYAVKVGKKAKIDQLKSASDIASVKTQEAVLRSTIETTKATLSALVGKEVKRVNPLRIKPKRPRYSIAKLYKKARTLAKVRVDEVAVAKAQKVIDKSYASQLPQVNLSAYAGQNYGQDIVSDAWDDETVWQVGVSVSYNLVDFGKRDIATQKAKIAKMQAGFAQEQTLRDLKKLLTQGVEQVKQSYTTYRGNLTKLRLSQEAQKIEQARYESDAVTLNDLLLAKGKTWLARASVIESKYNYQKSRYYIDYLMERGVK